jgi:pimeloyl-ACP methyl ester carboxylesterase
VLCNKGRAQSHAHECTTRDPRIKHMKTNSSTIAAGGQTSPIIVCLHASGSSSRQWKPFIERIGHRARVIALDMYGHGGAPNWNDARAFTLSDEAARASRSLTCSGGRVHLVGHSYGGAVALRIALDQPERVASLTLYEPVPFATLFASDPQHPAAAEVRLLADGIDRSLRNGFIESAAERFVTYWSGNDAWRWLTGPQRTTIASRMPSIDRHFKALAADATTLSDYASLRIPVLLMSGTRTNASTRRLGDLLAFALSQCRAEMVEGLDHMGPVTAPDIVIPHIKAFIGQQVSATINVGSHLYSAAA